MKKIFKSFFAFLCFLPLIISCSSEDEYTLGLKLGSSEESWDNRLSDLLKSGVLKENKYGWLRGGILCGSDSLPVVYKINLPYPSSNRAIYSDDSLYQKGALRSIEIDLRGDSICEFVYKQDEIGNNIPGTAKIEKFAALNYSPCYKSKIDKIRNDLIVRFGRPHKSDTASLYNSPNSSQAVIYPEKTDVTDSWELDKFDMEFHRRAPFYSECYNDTMYPAAHIVFKMKGHDDALNSIKKSIKDKFRPNDLIDIKFTSPSISSVGNGMYILEQPFKSVRRKGPEEDRGITGVKFDIVYQNNFKEEILRIDNCIYEIKQGLFPSDAISSFGSLGNYKIYCRQGEQLNYLMNNIKEFPSSRLSIRIDVRKIVFTDGEVFE
jgi:hypothetical protein